MYARVMCDVRSLVSDVRWVCDGCALDVWYVFGG